MNADMAAIDKNLYEDLNQWWHGERPKHQYMLYVNSRDRRLTNATVRKLMYEIDKEDIHGEEYVKFFSARNFYKNMREYYTHVARMYMRTPGRKDSLEKIIDSIPPTGGWLTLIVADLEDLAGNPDEMEKMFRTFIRFARKRANVILIGNGDHNDVFSGCRYAVREIKYGLAAKEEDHVLMIGSIAQDEIPETEKVTYETYEEEQEELNFCWTKLNEQLEYGYFGYEDFKILYEETLEYLLPRVTKEQIFRKDLRLIENIGDFKLPKSKEADGCDPWELDAAAQFSEGLHEALINTYGDNDDLSEGTVWFWVSIEERQTDYGAVHISGSLEHMEEVRADTVSSKLDHLAEIIRTCTYEGDELAAMKLIDADEEEDAEDAEKRVKEAETAHCAMKSLENAIKQAADKTVNKTAGKKFADIGRLRRMARGENEKE